MTCMRKFSILVLFSWLLIFLDQLVVRRSLTFEFVVRNSVLWSPLQFPHKNDVRFVFTSSCLYEGSCFITVICVCLRILVSNTYCVIFFVAFVDSFSGLFIFDCHFGFLWRLLDISTYNFSCNIYLLWWTTFRGLKMLTEFSI